jgi:hypothetical protein
VREEGSALTGVLIITAYLIGKWVGRQTERRTLLRIISAMRYEQQEQQ